MVREFRKRCRKESTQLEKKTLSIFIQQSINRLYSRHFIQGGSLIVAEVRQQEEEQRRELERDEQSRPRRQPKCSDCGIIGHDRCQCSNR